MEPGFERDWLPEDGIITRERHETSRQRDIVVNDDQS
jgi:hypothetical protein